MAICNTENLNTRPLALVKAKNTRNLLIIELMARGGMRISEVLNLTASDVEDRKLIIRDVKSGKAAEHVFIP